MKKIKISKYTIFYNYMHPEVTITYQKIKFDTLFVTIIEIIHAIIGTYIAIGTFYRTFFKKFGRIGKYHFFVPIVIPRIHVKRSG